MSTRTIYDQSTHYRAVRSTTGTKLDGFPPGSLIEWECAHCGARSAHIDGITHWRYCRQRDVDADDAHGPGFDGHPHR